MKKLMAALLLFLIPAALLAACGEAETPGETPAAAPAVETPAAAPTPTEEPPQVESGRYGATECTDADGTTAYYLDGEYLTLEDDGRGTLYYGGMEYDISWTYEGGIFRFEDSDGDRFEGSCTDGTIEGLYGGVYRYVFCLNAEPVVEER